MSKQQLISFLELVNADSGLQEKLKVAVDPDAVASLAQSAGFESVSAELIIDFLEYVSAQSAAASQETEQELLVVSGGGLSPATKWGIIGGSAAAGTAVLAGVAYLGYQTYSDNSAKGQANENWYSSIELKYVNESDMVDDTFRWKKVAKSQSSL